MREEGRWARARTSWLWRSSGGVNSSRRFPGNEIGAPTTCCFAVPMSFAFLLAPHFEAGLAVPRKQRDQRDERQ